MKKLYLVIGLVSLILVAGVVFGGEQSAIAKKNSCTTIQEGTLLRSDGVPIAIGYDEWGYNYQAQMFNGKYCDAYRDAAWCQPYKDVDLLMKWNNAWLSNKDCDGDGLLDRHYGYPSYIGSGAWLTNEQRGVEDGKIWTYFVKIVAKPTIGYTCPEPGYAIWGDFCVIQEVNGGYPPLNEPYGGNGAVLLVKPAGFGAWK